MRVTLYDATADERTGLSLEGVPSVEVEVQPGLWVADVLKAGGHMPYSSFALVTAAIEADVGAGDDHTIDAPVNLFGIDDKGAIRFQDPEHIHWADFLRASQAGLYEGDPTRIVVYPYGGFGGLEPDGVWEMVLWLFENRDVAKEAMEWVAAVKDTAGVIAGGVLLINERRKKQIAEKWRESGFTAPKIRHYLARCPQWDASQFAKQTTLTEIEARLALTNAGYQPGQDGLWRPADTEEGRERRKGLEEIEKRAQADIYDEWI